MLYINCCYVFNLFLEEICMRYCNNCGHAMDDNASFCLSCGAPAQPAQQQAPVQPQQPVNNYVPNYAPAQPQSTWDGGVLDTIVNSIVASLIISFTCGIATPWAIVYMMRFIVEHAIIDGKRMRFDGTGGQLFAQWIKWFLLTIITCGIYSFWVTPRLYKWVASHIHQA